MVRRLTTAIAVGLSALAFSSTAAAYAVTQDGMGMDVSYSLSGLTASFRVEATADATASAWLGTTLDAFSLQFGSVGQGQTSFITAFTPLLSG
jgi:hypothetical protein